MSISTYEHLTAAAEQHEENGRHEQAAEVAHLASVALGPGSSEEDEPFSTYSASSEYAGIIASDVEEQPIDWFWGKWIPLKVVTFLIGEGGIGKSTLANWLAKCATTGSKLPDGSDCLPGGVVIVSLEEDTNSVVKPRLREMGADLSRISFLSEVKRNVKYLGETVDSPFMLPDDLAFLEQEIIRVGASLVILDPLMEVVNPNKSTYREQSAREILGHLQRMAARLGVAIVMVGHFTKGSGKDPIDRMGGSKGFSNKARSIIFATKDPANPRQNILFLGKHSLCEGAPQIVFQRTGRSQLEFMTGLTSEQKEQQERQRLGQARVSVLNLLKTRETPDFTPTEITQKLNLDYGYIRVLLGRMANAGQIEQTDRGFYRLPRNVTLATLATLVTPKIETQPTTVLDNSVPVEDDLEDTGKMRAISKADIAAYKTTVI